jgi:hypothetical protein
MRIAVVLTACIILCAPTFVHAGVLISEVAWMGTAENANAEWIELYNTGSSISLEGWTLSARDGQPAITLTSSLQANTYALFERTSDASVPSVSALLIYTGALGNDGEKLELRDQSGTLVDSVDGLDVWSIGGSNETKDTLQRMGEPAVGTWITAPASPLYGVLQGSNTTSSSKTTLVPDELTKSTVIYASVFEETERPKIESALILEVEEERTVTVGVLTDFSVRTFKGGGEEFVCRDIEWNFGDGSVGKGREVHHTFMYTGDYVVSIQGRREGFLKEVHGTAQMIVHVAEPSVKISQVNSAYVEMQNTSSELAEISNFVLVSGDAHFIIPRNTFVLPNTHIRFPWKTIGMRAGENATLFRPDGSFVATFLNIEDVAQNQTYTAPKEVFKPSIQESASESTLDDTIFSKTQELLSTPQTFTQVAQAFEGVEESEGAGDTTWWWFFALGIVISIAILAVILMRREQEEVIEGFYIESD